MYHPRRLHAPCECFLAFFADSDARGVGAHDEVGGGVTWEIVEGAVDVEAVRGRGRLFGHPTKSSSLSSDSSPSKQLVVVVVKERESGS